MTPARAAPAAAARPGAARALAWLPDRLAAAPWPVRLGACGALGALAALGQVPASVPWATLAALVVVLALARRGAGFGEGWAFGAGHFAVALRWIVEPFQVDADAHGWMAPFALLFLAGGMALWWGAAFWGARRLRLGTLGLVALWALAEWARGHAFSGFPWALLGHVWTDTPIVQLAAWTGANGLTLLTLGLAALVARLGASLWLAAPAAALAAAWAGLDPGPPPPPEAGAPVVRVVQPNVPQRERWDPALQPGHRARLLALTAAGTPPDLVLWPETVLPDLLEDIGPTLAAAAQAAGAPLALGAARAEAGPDGVRYFNGLAVTDAAGRVVGFYDKAHLVPFGEYIPGGRLIAWAGLRGLASRGDGFTPGPGPALVNLPGVGLARPLVCYEGIFAGEVAATARPRVLLLVTNDSWFGERAGPAQHFELGRLRAVELGLPLVRSANTGISAVVDGKGRVLAALPLHEAGAFDAPLPPALAPTLYARAGDGPALAAIALLLALALGRRGPGGRGPGGRGPGIDGARARP